MHFYKTRNKKLALVFLFSLISKASLADGQPIQSAPFNLLKGHLLLELGGFYATQGKAQDINIRTLVGNRYTVLSHSQGNGLVGVGYMLDGPQRDRFNFSYGANIFFFGTTATKGFIIEEHRDTNLSYSYKIQNVPLYFMAKNVIQTNQDFLSLALDLGIGPNFINASKYREVPLTIYTVPDNGFSNKTSTAFTATVGAGIRLNNLTGKIPLECGYRFFYLGQGQLAKTNDLIINTLKTGDNYANAIMCSVTI